MPLTGRMPTRWNPNRIPQIIEQRDDTQKTQNTEDTLLLRKIVKLLESNAVVDITNRQKVTIDSITSGAGAPGVAVTGADSLAATTNWPTRLAPIQQPGSASWTPCWIGPVDQRFQIIDAARLVYDNGIRSHLTFT